jgi:hypothetical protein
MAPSVDKRRGLFYGASAWSSTWVGVPPNASGIITPSATSQIMKCPRRTIATATAKDRRASVKNGARFDQFPLHAAESVGALSRRANKEWTSVIFNIVPGIGELLTRCGPYCDSPNLKRPNFNSMRVTERGRDATQNQLGSRGFNARDDCPHLRVGFHCSDPHRPLAAILNRLLLFCTSVESGNTASVCARRRSRSQPNSHFAGVDDHTPFVSEQRTRRP